MKLTITRDPEEFAARTGDLFQRRIECNLIATVSAGVLAGHYPQSVPMFAYVTVSDEVRFAALGTPPWEMLATALPLPVQSELIRRWLRDDPAVPGVEAPVDAARAIAAAWAKETGGATRCKLRERSYVVERVSDPPRPAPGELRLAREPERPLMLEWVKAFVRELAALPEERAQVIVDARAAERGLWVWDHNGPVSMLATAPQVAGAVRLGPVYTPPEYRRRGYAGSAVAAASREALTRRAQRCVLYTDATNPTRTRSTRRWGIGGPESTRSGCSSAELGCGWERRPSRKHLLRPPRARKLLLRPPRARKLLLRPPRAPPSVRRRARALGGRQATMTNPTSWATCGLGRLWALGPPMGARPRSGPGRRSQIAAVGAQPRSDRRAHNHGRDRARLCAHNHDRGAQPRARSPPPPHYLGRAGRAVFPQLRTATAPAMSPQPRTAAPPG